MLAETKKVKIEQIKSLPFFFIIGRPRSGTTLLRTLLDAHPNVIIPHESPVIMNLYSRYRKLQSLTEKDILRFISDLESQRIFGIWNIDRGEVEKNLLKCEGGGTYTDLIKVLYVCFNSVYDKGKLLLMGDKNPVYSFNFHKIFPIFTEAKYIHLIRDYRDQVVSLKRMDFEMSNPALVAWRWKKSVEEVMTFAKKYPGRFLLLKYESLVQNPEREMAKVTNFLGIPYDDKVFDFYKIENKDEFLPVNAIEKYHQSLLKPVSTQSVNRWETQLNNSEIAAAEWIAGRTGQKAGYTVSGTKMKGLWYLKYLPFSFYGMVWNTMRKITFVLPFGWRKLIWKYSPVLPRVLKRKNGKQSNGN